MPDDSVVRSEDKEDIERIPPTFNIPYSEFCFFEDSGELLLSNKRKYTVSISVNIMANEMHPVNCGFETGAGPSLIEKSFLEAERLKALQAISRPSFRNGTNQKVRAFKKIALDIRTKDTRVTVLFGTVRSLAVSVLLVTSFIDSFLKGVFLPNER